jgi:CRISPR-associated Csx14 family protein
VKNVKTLLINLMGTTPMVATEMYEYLKNDNISDVMLIHTSDKNVMSGTYAVKASLEEKFHARVHTLDLGFEDITEDEDLDGFIEKISVNVKRERESYNINNIIINLSGGRKIQTMALSIYAGIFGFNEVYNIINHDIQNYNERYELIKDKINEFNCKNYMSKYNEYKKEIEDVFYPGMEKLSFLKVPVIKFPQDEINRIKIALNTKYIEGSDLEDYRLNAYRQSGLLTYDNSRIYNTTRGDIIKKYLE